jgi:5-methylthioadenosine/S-adenosylhomocysteine deaminase
MRMASLVQKQLLRDPAVMSSAQSLRLATQGSADALGLGSEVGSLQVGKRADVIVVDLSPPHTRPIVEFGRTNIVEQLVWSANGADVRDTIVDGIVLMRNRRIQTLKIDDLADQVDGPLVDLLKRAGVLEKRFVD